MTAAERLYIWEGEPLEHWRRAWGLPELHIFEAVGSTNDVLRALALSGAPAGTTVLAEVQTAGRGRGGRTWHAPERSSLLMSILLRPSVIAEGGLAPGSIPLRLGLAIARAVEPFVERPIGVKWPNDVVAPGAGKIAGILCEGSIVGRDAYLVAGIGVNVNQRKTDFPPEVRDIATSLASLTRRGVSRAAVAGAILRAIQSSVLTRGGPLQEDELMEIGRRDVLRSHDVTVDGEPYGTAVSIAPDGALCVRMPDGRIVPVYSGTVRIGGRKDSHRRETYP